MRHCGSLLQFYVSSCLPPPSFSFNFLSLSLFECVAILQARGEAEGSQKAAHEKRERERKLKE